jgi:hypothetical protein
MSAGVPSRDLDDIQRWMQAVIVHPQGVETGLKSPAAREHIDVSPSDLHQVILPSQNLSSLDRLRVYANAYYARLLECLREEFPALRHAVGDAAFEAFAFGYLQQRPSQSYTLAELGRRFPQFLAETKPATGENANQPHWTDFILDLAVVERAYSEVFDGPGLEGAAALRAEDVANVPPDRWPEARLVPAPCLRLLELVFPVHEYITAVRKGRPASPPEPAPTYLVITRRSYLVRRCAISRDEFAVLASLVAGDTVGTAIRQAMEAPGANLETLAMQLKAWFQTWTAAGYFQAIDLVDA